MNYELAKELKEAGFPQLNHYDSKWIGPPTSMKTGDCLYYSPTLEELIEACDEPLRLYVMTNKTVAMLDGPDLEGHGATPTEAVARLWLALNKKV